MTDNDKIAKVVEALHSESCEGLEVLRMLLELRAGFKKRIYVQPVSDETRKEKISRGEPFVGRVELALAIPQLVRHWRDVENVFRKQSVLKGDSAQPERCLEEFAEGKGGLPDMVERHGENGEVLHYMMIEALKPLYETYGEVYGKRLEDGSWAQPFCYICGGSPEMALVEGEEGRRYLHCCLCDTSWRYVGLKCPHCGNVDLEKLVSLALDSEPSSALHGCRSCGRYIKVIDARARSGDIYPELEDLRTSYLDSVARHEGFRPY